MGDRIADVICLDDFDDSSRNSDFGVSNAGLALHDYVFKLMKLNVNVYAPRKIECTKNFAELKVEM